MLLQHMGFSPNLPKLVHAGSEGDAGVDRCAIHEYARVKGKLEMQSIVREKVDALRRHIIRVSPAAHLIGVHVGVQLR